MRYLLIQIALLLFGSISFCLTLDAQVKTKDSLSIQLKEVVVEADQQTYQPLFQHISPLQNRRTPHKAE